MMQLKLTTACKIISAFMGSLIILLVILAYSQYLTLKKTLIADISGKATALIGQKIEIGDIFLAPGTGITISGITIKNPDSMPAGDFLKIAKVRLNMRYRELFHRRFSFRSVEVISPELSLVTAEGRPNISDRFREFLLKKGTAEFQIDEFQIRDAGFSFNNEPLYRVKEMNLAMNNLSSMQGAKTSIKASLVFLNSNKMAVEGWAYLKDEAKKFSISALSDDMNLSILRDRLSQYGIDPDTSRASISVQAEGDIELGISIKTNTELKETGISLFRKESMHSISLTSEVFLDMKKDSLTLNKALLSSGESSAIQARGTIQGLSRTPSYSAEIKVDKLDLSSFNFMKGLNVGGIITSDLIHVKGNLSSSLPQATGTMSISNGALGLEGADIQGIHAKIAFTSDKEFSGKMEGSARILKAGNLLLRQPVEMDLAVEGRGRPEKLAVKSEITLSGISLQLKGNDIQAAHIKAAYDGTLQGKGIAGKALLEAKDLAYDKYRAKDLRLDLVMDYDGRNVTVRNTRVVSDLFNATGEIISITLPQGRGRLMMQANNVTAAYPDKKAAVKGVDFMGSLSGNDKDLAGDLAFTVQQVSYQRFSSGSINGRGSIANNEFVLNIPSARLFDGSARISARGKAGDSPFPIAVTVKAEDINLAPVSEAVTSLVKTPYAVSGSAQLLSFDGTISSSDNVIGRASVRGKNISVTNAEKKTLLKDATVSSDLVFRGRDMEIKADASVAGLALSLSGNADRIFQNDRTVRLSLLLPEVMVNDIRTAFWDIVPDSVLYAGLQGSIALNLLATYSKDAITAEGALLLRDIALEGENNEYSLGPINGMLPIHYDSRGGEGSTPLPSYERTDFDDLKKSFANSKQYSGNEIKIGSVRYGFRLLEDISVWMEQKGRSLKINRISAKMFGGKINGTAFLDLSDDLRYRAGIITDGVSLTQLCEEMPPIRGYISGRIDGIATIKGSGVGLQNIIGKADFWTYSAEGEKTRISREFLEKIGGPQVRAYLGERRFNKGIMGLYIQKGFIIFRELEISNRNLLGITDLSVKVAPLNNRIAIDNLMWTITEAAQRAKKE